MEKGDKGDTESKSEQGDTGEKGDTGPQGAKGEKGDNGETPVITVVEDIVCGRTDMRKSIDGLCAIIQEQFSMEIDHSLYLFCGRKCDRIKAILKEPDGIVMIYKRLTAQGSYRWPRDKSEVRNLTWREFDWLMSGIDIEQPKAIKTT